jgi:hypothetical protein
LKVINYQSKHTYIIPKDKKSGKAPKQMERPVGKLVKIGRLWYHPLINSVEELKAHNK